MSNNKTPKYTELIAEAFSEKKAWRNGFLVMFLMALGLAVALVYQSTHMPHTLIPYSFALQKGPVTVQPGVLQDSTYIAGLARDDVTLALNWTTETVGLQYGRFLNRMTPQMYSAMVVKLTEEAKSYSTGSYTQAFFPKNTQILTTDTNVVRISGVLVRWEGEKEVYRQTVVYKLGYEDTNGLLSINLVNLES
jgi:hypothetical protein